MRILKFAMTAVVVGLLLSACVSSGNSDGLDADSGIQPGCTKNSPDGMMRDNMGAEHPCF
jgi:hypothetical protein